MEADDETAALALQLQLEDLASILAPAADERNGNGEAASDRTYALQLYQRELSTQKTILDDRRIAREVQAGRRILTTTAEVTRATPRDQSSARHIADRSNADDSSGAATEGPASDTTTNPTSAGDEEATVTTTDDHHNEDLKEFPSKPTISNVSEAEDTKPFTAASPQSTNDIVHNARAIDDDIETGESSTQGAIKGKGKRPAPIGDDDEDSERPSHLICDICRSKYPFFDVTTLSACQHRYCRACLDHLFSLSLTDEMVFPPRCCSQTISFDDVRVYLSADTARDFERKRPELETVGKKYCHISTCSTWISPTEIADDEKVGTCPKCAARTCVVCNEKAHEVGEENCPGDEAMKELLRAAGGDEWQRCYSCNHFVELNTGCYHIRYVIQILPQIPVLFSFSSHSSR
ncbi:IBR finger domain protein [Lasiodiplodia theobromae]|uniref:IBR finger domain protein n=1 Tax=Lasiodiplodia theobromae TaxID=45133 RepID=UPI0015C3A297|nr:IBR finger domain protein [Lasiodiplodia theobromae]KAF4537595.1 IBR finger domain protein [Lasiodiplodia theobromae]